VSLTSYPPSPWNSRTPYSKLRMNPIHGQLLGRNPDLDVTGQNQSVEDTSEYALEYDKALEEMVSKIVSDDTESSSTEERGGRFLLLHLSQVWLYEREIGLPC
jgi:hypothetical protein